jgi:uncharacterized protein (TIGR02679 family)
MSLRTELGTHLRGQQILQPVLDEIQRRYYAQGKLPKTVPITSDDQVKALRLLGCTRLGSGRLHLEDLEAAFRRSRFGCGVAEALEAWAGLPARTRVEEEQLVEDEWRRFADTVTAGRSAEDGDPAALWLADDGKYVRQEWANAHGSIRESLHLAVQAARAIQPDGEILPLAAFANAAAGGPHNLDLDRPARRYLDRILCCLFPEVEVGAPLTAECREKLLAAAGLVMDDISSDVVAVNLDGTGPIPSAMQQTGLPLTLPLLTVRELGDVRARRGIAYVVENPPVFRIILSRMASLPPWQRPTLVCTAGQLSIAARKLLDILVGGGATIHYSGDFDPGGLAIARGLVRRYGNSVRLWRMDTASHAHALLPSAPQIAPKKLRTLTADFPELCEVIVSRGVAYQEALANLLAEDVLARVDHSLCSETS